MPIVLKKNLRRRAIITNQYKQYNYALSLRTDRLDCFTSFAMTVAVGVAIWDGLAMTCLNSKINWLLKPEMTIREI